MSLRKYLKTQQENLLVMRNRLSHLQQQAETEQQRLQQLSHHLDAMESPASMSCSLSLRNLSGIKSMIHDLCRQQQARTASASAETERQLGACSRQASYNEGLHQLVARREQQQRLARQRQEQKQEDELAMQLHLRRQQAAQG